jgi:hypothetical protein
MMMTIKPTIAQFSEIPRFWVGTGLGMALQLTVAGNLIHTKLQSKVVLH